MKTIVITGASNGIGRAIAKELCEKYHIINIDKIHKNMKNTTFYECDLSNTQELQKTILAIKQAFSSVYALINNAGIFIQKSLDDQLIEDWDLILATNLKAPYLLSKEFSEMLTHSKGHIINITSTRALMSEAGTEAYSASKGGLISLTHSLAVSLSNKVKVNAISPGWIHTKKDVKLSTNDHLQHPSGRVGTPKDIAKMVKFLLKNDGFITGSNFVIDGGMTKKMIYIEE